MAALVGRQLVRRPLRLLVALPLFLLAVATPSTGELRPRLNRRLVALALEGITAAEYQALAEEVGCRLARRPNFPRPNPIAEAQQWTAFGCRVVIVTASEERLARTYLDGVGLTSVDLIASEVSFVDGRARFVRHNVGWAKVERVRDANVDLRGATLYTDSASDLPLALQVSHTLLVSPSMVTRRTVARRVPTAKSVRWA